MPIKDILAVVSSIEADSHVLAMGERLAQDHDAHLTVLVVNWIPAIPPYAEGWIMDDSWNEMIEASRKELRDRCAAIEKRLKVNVDRSSTSRLLITSAMTRSAVATVARHADLTLVSRPNTDLGSSTGTALLEGALFGSGRPVIVVPPNWKPTAALGKNIAIAWDAGREAARAVGDAGPFLAGSKHVAVITVDARPSAEGHSELPGSDIAEHLAHHGLVVDVRNVDSMGRSTSTAVQDEATAMAADLIVMGAYGRSRLQETIFGGMTREMLAETDTPVLMSH